MARVTELKPATAGVTGRHSNQLSYTREKTSLNVYKVTITPNTTDSPTKLSFYATATLGQDNLV